jgi:hypothetical protein
VDVVREVSRASGVGLLGGGEEGARERMWSSMAVDSRAWKVWKTRKVREVRRRSRMVWSSDEARAGFWRRYWGGGEYGTQL